MWINNTALIGEQGALGRANYTVDYFDTKTITHLSKENYPTTGDISLYAVFVSGKTELLFRTNKAELYDAYIGSLLPLLKMEDEV